MIVCFNTLGKTSVSALAKKEVLARRFNFCIVNSYLLSTSLRYSSQAAGDILTEPIMRVSF